MMACHDWRGLEEDLRELSEEVVCLSVVPDSFGDHDVPLLERCFPDVCVPFKERSVIDLSRPPAEFVTRHHRKEARRALGKVTVDEHPEPLAFLDEWVELHKNLVERHSIRGIKAFSRAAFAAQLALPGAKILRAMCQGQAVGAQLWLIHNGVAYGHVLAFNELGYKLGAQYALYWYAIERMAQYARWCDIGGVAGLNEEGGQGLAWFKQGWTKETRTAYFCGRVFDRAKYASLVEAAGAEGSHYFPAYRSGEMR
jgi:hypothetical protein